MGVGGVSGASGRGLCGARSGRGRGLSEGGWVRGSVPPSAPPRSPALAPLLPLSRPLSPAGSAPSSSSQALCISVGVRRDGRERERGGGVCWSGQGGGRGRGGGEGGGERVGPTESASPQARWASHWKHRHTSTHARTHTHTHALEPTHSQDSPPMREEVIRTSTGEGTHRCSPASHHKSAEKQPSPLRIQPSSKDIVVEDASAQVSMKSAANCETSCDPQDLVNHRILERLTLRG